MGLVVQQRWEVLVVSRLLRTRMGSGRSKRVLQRRDR